MASHLASVDHRWSLPLAHPHVRRIPIDGNLPAATRRLLCPRNSQSPPLPHPSLIPPSFAIAPPCRFEIAGAPYHPATTSTRFLTSKVSSQTWQPPCFIALCATAGSCGAVAAAAVDLPRCSAVVDATVSRNFLPCSNALLALVNLSPVRHRQSAQSCCPHMTSPLLLHHGAERRLGPE